MREIWETNRKQDLPPDIWNTHMRIGGGGRLGFKTALFHLEAWVAKLCGIAFFSFILTSARMRAILKINIKFAGTNN